MKMITFKDRVKLYVSAGDGGDGMCSFRREKFIPHGGPSGGDGGKGGDVILVAEHNQDSLLDLYYQPHQRAEHGERGGSKDCHGRNGKDLVVKVPAGTQAYEETTGQFLGEVLEDGDRLLIAKGGKGGLGNIHFATSTNRAPMEFTRGEEGEKMEVILELKLVADVGLVGYPNAGKSTLVSDLSAAHPRVAPYPFTTLNPVIGILGFEDFKTLRIADIPGLIDGAHRGVGLGHEFLRHVERTKYFVFVVDMAGTDGRHPADDYEHVRKELSLYNEDLAFRPHCVVANKMDVPEAQLFLEEFIERTGVRPLQISAKEGSGIAELKQQLYRHFYGGGGHV